MNCDAQPLTVFLLPDPQVSGAHNVISATSQAGPDIPGVVISDGNTGDLVPALYGVPEDVAQPQIEMVITGTESVDASGFAYRDVGDTLYIGADDARRYSRTWAHFYSGTHPDIEAGTSCCYVPASRRLITTAVDPVASEILIAYRDITGAYDAWTEYGIDPVSVGAPELDPNQPAGTHRVEVVTLPSGRVLLGYLYLKRIHASALRNYAVALLASDDGGLTWTYLRDDVIDLCAEDCDLRLTVSGSVLRIDAILVGTAPRNLQSAASLDGGLSWTVAAVSDTVALEPGTVGDAAPFAVAGLGGGAFLLITTAALVINAFRIRTAIGGTAWAAVGSGTKVNREVPGTVRGLGACVSGGRVYVMVSYDDGGGSNVDQVGLYYHPIGGAVAEGPGDADLDDPDPGSWQPVEGLTAYIGARFLPMRIRLVPTGHFIAVYGAAWDSVDDSERIFKPIAQLGGRSVQSFGNLQAGDALTSTDSQNNEIPLYDLLWQNIEGRPDGGVTGAGGATSPDTAWQEVTTGLPTIDYTPQRLSLLTVGVQQVSYLGYGAATTTDSWVLTGSTISTVVSILADSSQASLLHGYEVHSLVSSTDEVQFEARMDTTGVTIHDLKAASDVAAIAIDLTGYCEIRVTMSTTIGPVYGGTIVGMRLDDYFAAPVVDTFTLTSATAPDRGGTIDPDPEDAITWGSIGSGAGESEWREVSVSMGVTRDDGFVNPADLLGFPLTERVYLANGISASWGGRSGLGGDTYVSTARYVHGVDKALSDDTSLVGWRSTSEAAQTVILVADPDDASARFVHDGVILAGLETSTVAIDYDDDVAFGSPSLTTTVSAVVYAGTLRVSSISGNTLTMSVTLAIRNPREGELVGHRLRFTTGPLTGETFAVLRHVGVVLTLSGDVSAAASGNFFTIFATTTVGFHDARRVARYMRLVFAAQSTATGDFRLGHLLPGVRLDVPFPLQWTHQVTERSMVSRYDGPYSSHAHRDGADRRLWTGRLVNDYQQWREVLRSLLRSLAAYESRVMGLIVDDEEIRSIIRGYMGPAPHENSFWWDQDDGDGSYRFPGGDRRIDVLEVP